MKRKMFRAEAQRRIGWAWIVVAVALLLAGCDADEGKKYPGGTDQPYSTSNGVPIDLPIEVP